MSQLSSVWIVFVLFMVRIGIPFILLITLGTIMDNRQRKQREALQRQNEQQKVTQHA